MEYFGFFLMQLAQMLVAALGFAIIFSPIWVPAYIVMRISKARSNRAVR